LHTRVFANLARRFKLVVIIASPRTYVVPESRFDLRETVLYLYHFINGCDDARYGAIDALFPAAVGKHDLSGLVQVAAPIEPFVAARAQDPKIADAIFVYDCHHGLAVYERDVGFTG
jgi:hypothetical protein